MHITSNSIWNICIWHRPHTQAETRPHDKKALDYVVRRAQLEQLERTLLRHGCHLPGSSDNHNNSEVQGPIVVFNLNSLTQYKLLLWSADDHRILGRPKSSFEFFHHILQKTQTNFFVNPMLCWMLWYIQTPLIHCSFRYRPC